MEGYKRAFDFHELVNSVNTLNCLAGIEYGANNLQLNCVYNKMKNMWTEDESMAKKKIPPNLDNYRLLACEI